jgi:hypothetical protein
LYLIRAGWRSSPNTFDMAKWWCPNSVVLPRTNPKRKRGSGSKTASLALRVGVLVSIRHTQLGHYRRNPVVVCKGTAARMNEMEENPYRAPRFDVRAERDEALRMYGIDPQAALPARGSVRSRLTTGNIIGQWIAFVLFGAGPFLLGLLLLAVVPPWEVRLGLGGFCCAFGLFLGFFIARDVNEWVEIDAAKLRWKHLFTRQVNECDIGEIEEIVTLTLAFRRLATRITESIFGRIKGFEIRVAGRKSGVRVFRADPAMTNVRELIEAAVTKMYERGKVVPEIIDFEGTPLIRRLTLERRWPERESKHSIKPR